MEKFALSVMVFALACGLAFAQADAPQSTQPAAQPAVTTPSSGAPKSTTAGTGAITLANVASWRGTLMDAGCAGGAAASSPAADAKSADSESASGPDAKAAKPHKNHRNRTDPQAQACPVSNATTAFALKTKEGQVLKFDAVGNNRAAESLKAKWAQTLSAGKPIHAKVSGSINGSIVTVTSVD